jgi:hypothetical protein
MDEKTLAPNGGYGELERNLRTLAAALADYVRGRVSSIGR